MSAITWIIIGLLVISYYQYSNPNKANELLNPVWGPINSYIGNRNSIGNSTSGICPDVTEIVCGNNGISYKNSCEAALDNILEVTPGAC